jgi:hypothetical protein
VTQPAIHLDVLKINEMVRVSPNYENKGAAMGVCGLFSTQTEQRHQLLCGTLQNPVFWKISHKRKVNEEIHKNIILLVTDILTFRLKIWYKLM